MPLHFFKTASQWPSGLERQYVFQYCRGFESRSRRHELSSKKSTNIEGDDMMTFAIIVVSGIVEIQFLILQ